MAAKDEDRGNIPLLVLAGPTAVGKTELSLLLAQRLGAEIISADSAQVYRGLDIGSAKLRPEDRLGIPHHLIDVVEPDQAFSVADFQILANRAIDAVWHRGHLPMVVGGTGLWIKSLTRNYQFVEETDASHPLRSQLEFLGQSYGWDSVRRQLRLVDPDSWRNIHPHDHRRLIRALEVFLTTGRRLPRAPAAFSRFATRYWVLTRPMAELNQRIGRRVSQMLDQGFESEVVGLLKSGISPKSQSLSAIGYRDVVDWYLGKSSQRERDALIAKHTRAYAKRQLTWWRAEPEARWIDLSAWSVQEALDVITQNARGMIYRQNT
ncbi:MAG: tRNA (adenosine(37)-N6)-dimethylallyltransferase MiaA [Sulfobacillus sp.]